MAEGRQDRNSFFLSLSLCRPFFFRHCSEIEHRVPVDKPVLYGNRTGSSCGQPLKNPVGQDQPDQKQGPTRLSSNTRQISPKKVLRILASFVLFHRAWANFSLPLLSSYTRWTHKRLISFFRVKMCAPLFMDLTRLPCISRRRSRRFTIGHKKFCKRYN